MRRVASLTLIVTAIVLAAPAALAHEGENKPDPKELPWAKAWVQLGGFFSTVDSSFRFGVNNLGLGIDLNVEKFLGLKTTNSAFRLDGAWRVSRNRRHKLDASWFRMDRDGENILTEDIDIDGTTILEGATIRSIFNIDIIKLNYNYSFLLDKRVDLNVGGGLYVMPIELGIGEKGKDFTEESITAPLPVISLGFHFALTPKWYLRQDIDWMYLEISGVEGRILDLNVSIERTITKHIGLGLGVEILRIGVDAESDEKYPGLSFVGEVEYGYAGVQLYLKGVWP
jgi:hypothetical protein